MRIDNEDGGVRVRLEYFLKIGMGNGEVKYLIWCFEKLRNRVIGNRLLVLIEDLKRYVFKVFINFR